MIGCARRVWYVHGIANLRFDLFREKRLKLCFFLVAKTVGFQDSRERESENVNKIEEY